MLCGCSVCVLSGGSATLEDSGFVKYRIELVVLNRILFWYCSFMTMQNMLRTMN